jgi:hypothetical protein
MESSLRYFNGVRYELGEFVVMPNHVHAIVAPIAPCKGAGKAGRLTYFDNHWFSSAKPPGEPIS